jgi:hypothetical protein
LGDIKRLVFLTDALARNATSIEPAVAGVDHDRARLTQGRCGKREQTGEG